MIKRNYDENIMKKHILFIIPIMGALIAFAPIGISASTEESCSTTPATSPDLEEWTIETCGNGEQTWIKPDGTRCAANLAGETTRCGDGPPISVSP